MINNYNINMNITIKRINKLHGFITFRNSNDLKQQHMEVTK